MDPNSLKDENQSSASHVVVPPPAVEPAVSSAPQSFTPAQQSTAPVNPSAPVLPPGATALPTQEVPPIPPLFSQNPSFTSQNLPPATPPDSSDNQSFQDLPKKKRINAKTAAILGALLIVVLLPLSVFLVSQQQTIQNHASGTDLIATNPMVVNFDGAPYKVSDLLTTAEQSYSQDQINNAEVLKTVRDTWIERQILDKEQQDKSIDVPADEVTKLENTQDLSQQEAYYAVLKEKVTLLETNSLEAVSIGFWFTPPQGLTSDDGLTAAEISSQKDQIALSKQALAEIQTDLQANQDSAAVVSSITSNSKYASIKDLIGLNGNLVSTINGDLTNYSGPQIFEHGGSNLDSNNLATLFALPVGGIWTSPATDTNSSGYVYKVITKGNSASSYQTYDAWYSAQFNSLAKYPNPDTLR